jgi:hypothetical protein
MLPPRLIHRIVLASPVVFVALGFLVLFQYPLIALACNLPAPWRLTVCATSSLPAWRRPGSSWTSALFILLVLWMASRSGDGLRCCTASVGRSSLDALGN